MKKSDAGVGLALDGASLLEIASLDTSRVAARMADVDVSNAMARRRANLFNIVVAGGYLVPVDGNEGGSEVDRLRHSIAQLEGELTWVRKEHNEEIERMRKEKGAREDELVRLRREIGERV
jgi:hypothetical protein